ncbi:MAG: alpha/beta hydrolase [Bacteroidota bacterium]
MKLRNCISLVVCVLYLLIYTSCTKDDKINSLEMFDEICDIATFHGNLEGNIVVVNTQGGPLTFLDDATLNQFIDLTRTQSALWVNVHQEQTLNPSLFKSSDITFDEAKQHDLESVSKLKHVVDFFRNQEGKTVYVLGISFGAFITQELVATYGIDVADGYLIMVGRLNMDEDAWQPVSEGHFTQYKYDLDGNYDIEVYGNFFREAEYRNMGRLNSGLAFNRYTKKLNGINDLSKITYVSGSRDERVGPLSNQEVEFLRGKNADVVLSEGSGHFQAVDTGLNLLKQRFGIK